MSKKNAHINKYLTDKLPEPEIPADEAWANLNGMLGAAPVSGSAPANGGISPAGGATGGKLLGGLKWAAIALTSTTITAVLVVKLALSPNVADTKPTFKQAQPAEIRTTEDTVSTQQQTTLDSNEKPVAVQQMNPDVRVGQNEEANPQSSSLTPENKKLSQLKSSEKTQFQIERTTNAPALNERQKNIKPARRHPDNAPAFAASSPASRTFVNSANPVYVTRKRQQNDRYRSNGNLLDQAPGNPEQPADNSRLAINIRQISGTKGHFDGKKLNLDSRIAVRQTAKKPVQPEEKEPGSFHVGLEWSLNSPFAKTDYLFAGKDSVSKPANLLIPALVISRSWNSQQLTFTAAARQTYFGNNKTALQVIDPAFGDSSLIYYNYKLIKATGIQFSLQYHHRIAGAFSLGGGVGYTLFSRALIRQTTRNWQNREWNGPLAIPSTKKEVEGFMKPSQVTLKAGLLFQPGHNAKRLQAGFNVILPVTNISRFQGSAVKALNGQLFVRFMFL
ncbi:hypothetical protein [Dyadobacter sp. Leaf189]|uniref:hypothetical protein n=1 Tax=Dyadobacter sp. Leaf189 TaxID=1736295 RepID=UPI0006F8B025|nr:hypothetical protein [Dyadobacter sp. Leaf189]KQS24668.1 hypothetical protein ASG33_23170 [Dyadobacter sp. Leaf189]